MAKPRTITAEDRFCVWCHRGGTMLEIDTSLGMKFYIHDEEGPADCLGQYIRQAKEVEEAVYEMNKGK